MTQEVLRLSELYTSIQGEGPYAGVPTQFMRFGGCNLRCPGWPCDTQHAIDIQYRKEWKRHGWTTLLEMVQPWPRAVTFTGGEPFLQRHDVLEKLVKGLANRGYRMDCFTNGAIEWPEWAAEYMWMILDWKLPGSGEDPLAEKRILNVTKQKFQIAPKFTCANREDYDIAKTLLETYAGCFDLNYIYFGVAWGKLEEKELVEWILKDELDVNLNVQVHNYVWPRDERGR